MSLSRITNWGNIFTSRAIFHPWPDRSLPSVNQRVSCLRNSATLADLSNEVSSLCQICHTDEYTVLTETSARVAND